MVQYGSYMAYRGNMGPKNAYGGGGQQVAIRGHWVAIAGHWVAIVMS